MPEILTVQSPTGLKQEVDADQWPDMVRRLGLYNWQIVERSVKGGGEVPEIVRTEIEKRKKWQQHKQLKGR